MADRLDKSSSTGTGVIWASSGKLTSPGFLEKSST